MLDFIRRSAGSWMLKFILGAIVLVFIFWGVGNFRSGRMSVIAKVNGEKILLEQYNSAYSRTLERYTQMFGGNIPEAIFKRLNLKQVVLNDLINRALIRQKAEEMGIIVSDEEVQQVILNIPAFKRDGVFDQNLYQRALAQSRLTPTGFEAQVRNQLLAEKLRTLLSAGLDVPEDEARDYFNYENQQINLAFVQIKSQECEKDVKPKEEELQAWYEKHKEAYKTDPQIQLRYLLLKRADVEKEIEVGDDEIKNYYETHKKEFHEPERVSARHILLKVPEDASKEEREKIHKKAMDLYERLKKGEDFAKLAREFSEDPGSAQRGGDLGPFTRGIMVKPFDETAFSLKEGEISKPVLTKFGYHIIKVYKKTAERTKSLDEARPLIIQKLKSQKATKILWDKANAAYDEIIDMGSLEAYVKANELKEGTTGFFSRRNPPALLASKPDVLDSLFMLQKGELSSLLDLPQGVMVAEVVDKRLPYVPPLEEVKERVKRDYIRQQAKELCRKKADKILEAAKEKGLEKAAKEKGLAIEETGFFKRTDTVAGGKLPAQVVQGAKGLRADKPLPDKVLESGNSFYIVAFKAVKEADPAGYIASKKSIKDKLLALKHQTVFEDWLKHVRERAEIEYLQKL